LLSVSIYFRDDEKIGFSNKTGEGLIKFSWALQIEFYKIGICPSQDEYCYVCRFDGYMR